MQMRTPGRYDYTLTRMAIIQKIDDTNCWRGWGVTCSLLVENSVVASYGVKCMLTL